MCIYMMNILSNSSPQSYSRWGISCHVSGIQIIFCMAKGVSGWLWSVDFPKIWWETVISYTDKSLYVSSLVTQVNVMTTLIYTATSQAHVICHGPCFAFESAVPDSYGTSKACKIAYTVCFSLFFASLWRRTARIWSSFYWYDEVNGITW